MSAPPALGLPDDVEQLLYAGATLAVNISGGRDSQALLAVLTAEHRRRASTRRPWRGPLVAAHADLGRAEWPQTPAFVAHLAREAGVPLHVVRRAKGDLVQRIEERAAALSGGAGPDASTAAPPWPSSAARYCTSHLKGDPLNTWMRASAAPLIGGAGVDAGHGVVSAEGIRAAESAKRARKAVAERRTRIATRTRAAITWRPLLGWDDEAVWVACGTNSADLERRRTLWADGQPDAALAGWPCHPAYVMGNGRVSCALCVLATRGDLANGLRHAPGLARRYIRLEETSGYTFTAGLALGDLARELGLYDGLMEGSPAHDLAEARGRP